MESQEDFLLFVMENFVFLSFFMEYKNVPDFYSH
jgi:hypothetical protein